MALAVYLSSLIRIDDEGKVILQDEVLSTYKESAEQGRFLVQSGDIPAPWRPLLKTPSIRIIDYESPSDISALDLLNKRLINEFLRESKENFENDEMIAKGNSLTSQLHNFKLDAQI